MLYLQKQLLIIVRLVDHIISLVNASAPATKEGFEAIRQGRNNLGSGSALAPAEPSPSISAASLSSRPATITPAYFSTFLHASLANSKHPCDF